MKNAEFEIIRFDTCDIITTSGSAEDAAHENEDPPPCVQGAIGMDPLW